jgi:FAD/FMN-containing dehydrogenase
VIDLDGLREALDGELYGPDSPGYAAVRSPVNAIYRDTRPQLVLRCRSESDVVLGIQYARDTGIPVVPRGGGHCFAGRSSTDGLVLDLSGLDSITVTDPGLATVGAGARLGSLYAALHRHGRTVPAGCGDTVGIAGLTLGGGIGLLGRRHGLTCDRLVGARVVLADGRIVDCDDQHEPDLFWALRGAGGGQFGVVTSLRFHTVEEPSTTRIEAHWSDINPADLVDVVAAWQQWAPDAPAELTANFTVAAEPGRPLRATLFGASLFDEDRTLELLGEVPPAMDVSGQLLVRGRLPYYELKQTFADLDRREGPEPTIRIRSEFFSRSMQTSTMTELLGRMQEQPGHLPRQLTFTVMGGAYNRVPTTATAFAHRDERFLLEHIADTHDAWVDRSWAIAHADGSGHVYSNFPDPALTGWAAAYHAGNYDRLAAIKSTYDPHRLFDFPQSV